MSSGVGSGNTSGSVNGGMGGGVANVAGSGGSVSGGAAGASGGSGGQAGSNVGGAIGSAGAGGMAGGNTGPAKPTLVGKEWAFTLDDVTLQVDPSVGGRVTTFKLGENLLTGPDVNPTYWGSTLWISPEATLWMQPPPAPIDSDPYTATATDTTLTLQGMPYAKLGIRVTKTVTTDAAQGAFKLKYELINTSQADVKMAPWEVTRVRPRGVTFFPKGPSISLSMGATFPTTEANGIVWYTYDANAVTADSKLYADATEGWVAHAAASLLFIKSFADVTADKLAPKEGDVELYTNKLHTYVEIENQGAYVNIAPGASASWTVTWYLRKLPAGVEAMAGSEALAKLVRDTIAGK